MSVMAYANSLMLDFRCVIIPRFVFATSHAFDGERINDKKIAGESNKSPTNSFALPKRYGAKFRFSFQLTGKISCDPALPRAHA